MAAMLQVAEGKQVYDGGQGSEEWLRSVEKQKPRGAKQTSKFEED